MKWAAQNVIQTAAPKRHERSSFRHGRLDEFGIEGGTVELLQIAVGACHAGNTRQHQFSRQAALVVRRKARSERPLASGE